MPAIFRFMAWRERNKGVCISCRGEVPEARQTDRLNFCSHECHLDYIDFMAM